MIDTLTGKGEAGPAAVRQKLGTSQSRVVQVIQVSDPWNMLNNFLFTWVFNRAYVDS